METLPYWNNKIHRICWPSDTDIYSQQLLHTQRVYYIESVPLDIIQPERQLQDLCQWANFHRKDHNRLLTDPMCLYDGANLVKINMWIHDIRRQGIVKPMLLAFTKLGKLIPNTGASRLLGLELVPEVTHVRAFVSVHEQNAEMFTKTYDATLVETLDQMANILQVSDNTDFSFQFTENLDDYGLFWYEYNTPLTREVTPDEDWCMEQLALYLDKNPNTEFTIEWFNELHFDRYS